MNVPKSELKKTLLKSYTNIVALENALLIVHRMNEDRIGISVIGNMNDNNVFHESTPNKIDFHRLLRELLGEQTEFGTFINPELGHLFVSGFLVYTFLNPVGESNIGILSGGPYGVLRGLGISEQQSAISVKNLSDGSYLLIVRGNQNTIENLASVLVD